MEKYNFTEEFRVLTQTVRNLVKTNRVARIITILLSVYLIYRAGHSVGEFIYYLIH